ncbi:MAG TPA: aminotransferase class I/II-fold pyridoxal phosphate-dependent enzyme [Blastocatellia bacterium]|nr:aminotransferase class I/II-fold pyridoxal phosphate-dependent enzyme [Blastocatellia bacterium]
MGKELSTIAIHGGEEEPHALNSIAPPIFQTAVHSMRRFDDLRRYARGQAPELYLYARSANPTVDLAARKVAALEGAEAAVVTASGTAAAFVIAIALLETGDEIVAMHSVYGGTYRMMRDILPRLGIKTHFFEGDELERAPGLINSRTRILWVESPTNPLNRVVDLEQTAHLARKHGLVSVIDNTFASPVNQRPIERGIDIVMHSATKYLSGHSDLVAGAVCGRADLIERIAKVLAATGGVLSPAAAALLVRGIKTLDVRVQRVNSNSMRLATALASHPKVAQVHYAGLASSPYHGVARRQMTGFGGVVTIELPGGEAQVERFCDSLKLIKIATSLGGTETIVTSPVLTSHTGYSEAELAASGVSPGTVRFSVGLEASEDLLADVEQALEAL